MPGDVAILFVRHGETDWNAVGRYQGQQDVPLNALGRRQALRNGEALLADFPQAASWPFIASPLSRTRETMEILRRAMQLEPDGYRLEPRLMEIHYGHWEGELQSDLKHLDPAGIAARRADPFNWRPSGGESYADLTERVAGWLSGLREDCVLVSHGGVSRALRGLMFPIPEADITRLEVPQDRVLRLARRDGVWTQSWH